MGKRLICLAADKRYARYAYVTVFSLLKNRVAESPCEIALLASSLSGELNDAFSELNSSMVSIRIIDMEDYIEKFKLNYLFAARHLTIAAYFRLFIPEMFHDYEKVLYLDCDIIVSGNIEELLAFDVSGATLGALNDADRYRADADREAWINKYLGIALKNYFCSGVLLFNIPECLAFGLTEKALVRASVIPEPQFADQDVLNAVCAGTVKQIPPEWHVMAYAIGKKRLQEVLSSRRQFLRDHYAYMKAAAHPKLIHYCGGMKPWSRPFLPLADVWWKYAEQTPLYGKYFKRTKANKADKNVLEIL